MKKIYIIILMVLIICIVSACSKSQVDKDKSPSIIDVLIESMNENSEETQYVKVSLTFDKEVKLLKETSKSLLMTIAGKQVDDSDYKMKLSEDAKKVVITIHVELVNSGEIVIKPEKDSDTVSEITDKSGKYAVQPFSIKAIIPSGMVLSTVSSEPGTVVKSVDSSYHVRGITWIKLLENGEPVPCSIPQKSEELDGAIAVHGHDFLIDDEDACAKNITERLTAYYGSDYSFTCSKNQITAKKLSGDGSEKLDIEVYTYLKVKSEELRAKN